MIKPLDYVNIVGLGGIGSYLLPPLLKTLQHSYQDSPPTVNLIDGDILEEKNIDRQLYGHESIGMPKVEAIRKATAYRGIIEVHPEYFTMSMRLGLDMRRERCLWICCADNHMARLWVLQTVDVAQEAAAIIAGNGSTDADAYYYDRTHRDRPTDPRVLFPEILTDRSGSPVHAAGCTGEAALDETPQLPAANFLAAAYALHLFAFHYGAKAHKVPQEYRPIYHRSNFSGIHTQSYGQITESVPA